MLYRASKIIFVALLLGSLAWPGCGPVDEPGRAVLAHFQIPREGVGQDFDDLPWPNDIRRDPDGTVSLAGFPTGSSLIASYVALIDAVVTGWGTSAGIFFRFSGPLDPARLPSDAAASLAPDASAYLVNVDPGSGERGERVPVEVVYREQAGAHIGPHHVVLLPAPGFAMRQGSTYAAIVTRSLVDARGEPLRRSMDMIHVLSADRPQDTAAAAAWEIYAPLREHLDEEGISPDRVLTAAVFTTQSFLGEMAALRQAVLEDIPEPPAEPLDLAFAGSGPGYHLYEGTFEGPIYQSGDPPYSHEGGAFVWDQEGRPVLQRTEPLRFALSVPVGPMPQGGWPILLYAHGTGGSYRTFVNNGVAGDLARIYEEGILVAQAAVIGIDQVLHGPRCGQESCNPELNFFNFQNPLAGRDNVRQGALDNVQLLRQVKAMYVQAAPETGASIRFDAQRIGFMGHSQGGITGPPFLAVAPEVSMAVLSGAGGNMILSLLTKTEPVDIPTVIEMMLNEPVDRFHPVLSLIQLFIEPADPVNYGRSFALEPLPGIGPKHIFLSQGLVDHYTPPVLTEALAVSAGLQLAGPHLEPVPWLDLAGRGPVLERPVEGNLLSGAVTGVMTQYVAWMGGDGHFVLFGNPDGNRDYRQFVGTWIRDGVPTLTSP